MYVTCARDVSVVRVHRAHHSRGKRRSNHIPSWSNKEIRSYFLYIMDRVVSGCSSE
jgi:hypothetical protein